MEAHCWLQPLPVQSSIRSTETRRTLPKKLRRERPYQGYLLSLETAQGCRNLPHPKQAGQHRKESAKLDSSCYAARTVPGLLSVHQDITDPAVIISIAVCPDVHLCTSMCTLLMGRSLPRAALLRPVSLLLAI